MTSENNATEHTPPSVWMALTPVLALIIMLGTSVAIFGDGTTGGPGQVALMAAGIIAGGIGVLQGATWLQLEHAVAESVRRAMPAIFILLMVGGLIGVWMLSGTVPFLIYWGLQIISPEIFYLATALICAIVAVAIGSSWTTAGTVGVALIGIAAASGLSMGITAGAIISGAYFGDKLSPLSDSTNLAAAVTETDLFEHIRFLLWTTVPAILFALIGFGILSLSASAEIDESRINAIISALEQSYNLSPLVGLPLIVTIGLAVLRQPAFTSLLAGTVVAAILALFTQSAVFTDADGGNGALAALKNIWITTANGYTASTSNAELNDLLSRGGMESMMGTIWLIISAMFFGGMMERSGSLNVLVRYLIIGVHSGGGLMRRAGVTAIGANLIASDQYLSIVLPSRMYAEEFKEYGLQSKNLSRVLEDYGTVTSPMIPWNTCGAFMASTLGVSAFVYLPYCLFNLASPVISYAYATMNYKVELIEDGPDAEAEAA